MARGAEGLVAVKSAVAFDRASVKAELLQGMLHVLNAEPPRIKQRDDRIVVVGASQDHGVLLG